MTASSETVGGLDAFDLAPAAKLTAPSTFDLGCELLRRLRQPVRHQSYADNQKHLALLNALAVAIERALDTHDNRFSTALLAGQFDFVRHCWRTHGVPIRGAAHLEIGSGAVNPFARMFTHLLAGAARAWCLELDRLHDPATAVRALGRLAMDALVAPTRLFGDYPVCTSEVLERLTGFDLAKLRAGDPAGLDATRLEFLQRSVTDTGLGTASVDVVVSNSVLEHLPDPDAALSELARVTKPGGFAIHGIDVSDHRRYGNPSISPIEFLTIQSDARILYNCNRLRLCEFEERFAAHGFSVLERWCDTQVAVTPELRRRLVPPWSRLRDDQLDTMWGLYVMRRT